MRGTSSKALANNTDDSKNPDLEKLHSDLIDAVDTISDAIVEENDLQLVREMVRQVDEINLRVASVGSLLFSRQTGEISELMQSVDSANQRLELAVQQAGNGAQLVNSVTALLAAVDEVIAVARTF